MRIFRHHARLACLCLGTALLGAATTASTDAEAQLAPTAQSILDQIQVLAPNGLNYAPFGNHPGLIVQQGGTVSLYDLALLHQAILARQRQAFALPDSQLTRLSTVPGTYQHNQPALILLTTRHQPGGALGALASLPFTPENLVTRLRILSLDTEARSTALERLIATPGAGAGSPGFSHASNLSSQLGQRLAKLRGDKAGTQVAALQLAGTRLASAGSDPELILTAYKRARAADGFPLVSGFSLPDRVGVFASGNMSFGDSDVPSGREDYTTGSLTAGIDYRLTPTLVVGVAGTYSTSSTDISYGGNTESRTKGGTLYGTFYKNEWYTDLYAGAAVSNADNHRVVPIGAITLEASSETDATIITAGTRIGRNFTSGDITAGPFAALDYVRSKTDAYNETGAGAFSLNVPGTRATSLRSNLGAQAAYTFTIGTSELAPYAKASWVHEFHDDTPVTTAAFAGAPTATFQSTGSTPDTDWAQLGGGITTRFNDSLLLSVGASTDLGRAATSRTQLSVSLRAAF